MNAMQVAQLQTLVNEIAALNATGLMLGGDTDDACSDAIAIRLKHLGNLVAVHLGCSAPYPGK